MRMLLMIFQHLQKMMTTIQQKQMQTMMKKIELLQLCEELHTFGNLIPLHILGLFIFSNLINFYHNELLMLWLIIHLSFIKTGNI